MTWFQKHANSVRDSKVDRNRENSNFIVVLNYPITLYRPIVSITELFNRVRPFFKVFGAQRCTCRAR